MKAFFTSTIIVIMLILLPSESFAENNNPSYTVVLHKQTSQNNK